MATTTTNIQLTKPDYTDPADIAVINGNMDKVDSAISCVEDGLAIVANGNTHVAITSGQYVYVRNHSSLAEGLYKATAAISANATLSTSNLTADAKGGLNALKSDVDTLNNNLEDLKHFKFIGTGTVELTVSNSFRAMMMVAGNSVGTRGIVNLASSGAGATNAANVGGDTSALTFNHTTNKISITFASPAQCLVFVLNGTITI